MPSGKRSALFGGSIPAAGLHPNYQSLLGSRAHLEARNLMDALLCEMGDPNGNFVRDFMASGFHSRLFELGCYAYLKEAGFDIDRSHERPDFLASYNGLDVALEASAASVQEGNVLDISVAQMMQWPQELVDAKVYEEFPRRILSVLSRKLKKKYHLLEQCRGKALVIAVAPYYEAGSVFQVDEALVSCLYGGIPPAGRYQPRTPFFSMPGADSVSAVLYCNQFTVPRFLRMAKASSGKRLNAIRTGNALIPECDGASLGEYRLDLSKGRGPKELWSQGVSVFHNPNAWVRLMSGALPCTCEFYVSGSNVIRQVGGFHTLTSFMFMF